MSKQKQIKIRIWLEEEDYRKVKEITKKYQLEINQAVKILLIQRLREGETDIF